MSESCLFCGIAAGSIKSTLVHEDDRAVAFEDINPQAPTHVLVIPRQHVATLDDARAEHRDLLGHLMLVCAEVARQRGVADRGYRVITNCRAEAGQTVFHLHVHLLAGRAMHWPPG